MNKIRRLPHEGATRRDDVDDAMPRRRAPGEDPTDDDTEGHRASAVPRMPGTGGDAFPRRPSSGGELTDEDDVEGHRLP